MTTNEQFLMAALPEPVVLLGQRLEAYSVGHELLLQRYKSPFLMGPEMPKGDGVEDHLWMAVFICAQRFEEAQAELRHPGLPQKVLQWKKAVGWMSPILLAEKIRLFMEYVDAGSQAPNVRVLGKARMNNPGSPWLAWLVTVLCSRLHFSFSEAMNCPYGLAQWLFCTWWERERALVIRAEDDEGERINLHLAAKAKGLELVTWRN